MNAKRLTQNRKNAVVAAAVLVLVAGSVLAMASCGGESVESPDVPLNPQGSESLATAPIQVDGATIEVAGERTVANTVVRYGLPAGLQELGMPMLVTADGAEQFPLRMSGEHHERVAWFPATEFGTSVEFRLSNLGKTESTTTERRAVIALGPVLERHDLDPGDSSSFVLGDADIASASGLHVLPEGQMGRRGSDNRPWVGFLVEGSFRPGDSPGDCPCVFDASGEVLPLRTVGTGYMKDADGNILPGATDFSVWYQPSETDLSFVTLIAGRFVQVIAVEDAAVLQPRP